MRYAHPMRQIIEQMDKAADENFLESPHDVLGTPLDFLTITLKKPLKAFAGKNAKDSSTCRSDLRQQ